MEGTTQLLTHLAAVEGSTTINTSRQQAVLPVAQKEGYFTWGIRQREKGLGSDGLRLKGALRVLCRSFTMSEVVLGLSKLYLLGYSSALT